MCVCVCVCGLHVYVGMALQPQGPNQRAVIRIIFKLSQPALIVLIVMLMRATSERGRSFEKHSFLSLFHSERGSGEEWYSSYLFSSLAFCAANNCLNLLTFNLARPIIRQHRKHFSSEKEKALHIFPGSIFRGFFYYL